MEDSILLIIKYLLKKKNTINDDTSIDSFFSNGVSFPLFMAKIFDFPSFPGIVEKPESEEQCQFNNNKALQFLIENNKQIKLLNPKFETKEDRNELLKQILIHQCFPDTPIKIKSKLDLTFESTHFQIKKINDMLNFKTMSLILHIFTKESFPITDSLEEISQNCKKCNIPFVVNESSLEKQNAFVFLIQIQIFYDFFSSCSPKMIDSIQSKLNRKNEEFQSESENKSQSYENTETDSESYSEEYHYTPLVENLNH